MEVTAKRSVVYRGKLYRAGDVVDVDRADINHPVWRLDPTLIPDQVDEPTEPTKLPPLKTK